MSRLIWRLAFSIFAVAPFLVSCKSEESTPLVDCNSGDLALQILSQTNTACALAIGEIEVAASGGSGSYNYKIGTRDFQPEPVFSDLPAETYTVTVKDGNGCEASTQVAIVNEEGVNMEVAFTDAGCQEENGSITITAVNGTAPYEYKLGDADFQTNNSFTSLAKGDYHIVTKDASGCEISREVSLLSGISYSASVAKIIETNCAVSGCHNGTQFPDLREFSNIQASAGAIKAAVVSGRMPKGGSLTQAEIDAISCWVDDGALDN